MDILEEIFTGSPESRKLAAKRMLESKFLQLVPITLLRMHCEATDNPEAALDEIIDSWIAVDLKIESKKAFDGLKNDTDPTIKLISQLFGSMFNAETHYEETAKLAEEQRDAFKHLVLGIEPPENEDLGEIPLD